MSETFDEVELDAGPLGGTYDVIRALGPAVGRSMDDDARLVPRWR